MIKNIVTNSHLNQFQQQFGYSNCDESKVFELFSIYCIVSKYIKSETISCDLLADLNIGDGGDWGIDGLVVVVNGSVVTTAQEVDDLLSATQSLRVQFILIQAKTSSQFKVAELGQTLDGLEYIMNDVYGNNDKLPRCNEDLVEYRRLIKHIYSKSANFEKGKNPEVDVFYVTCGEYTEQPDHKAKIDKETKVIESFDLTSDFTCHMIGEKDIVSMYKDTKFRREIDIKVEHKIPLPDVENVRESYLCLIPFSEYRKLIIEDEKIVSSVFYDNVRSYQGENAVNKSMAESLRGGNLSLFAAMNNGITIIVRNLAVTGTNMRLEDYQIVNGCQTSHVLYENRNIPNIDALKLTVKIISSKDKEIRDKIIVGNNSQTEVKREQLVALLDVQKQIENYYNAQNKFEKLYYERRSKQYKFDDAQVPSYKVITIPFQIKAFVSMILGVPDKVSGYYGSIVERFDKDENRIFAQDNHPALYYTSALACYKMTALFSNGVIDRKYKKIKFHLLLAFRLVCESSGLPKSKRGSKIQEYCDHLCEILCDEKRCLNGFKTALELIDKVLGRDPQDRDRMRHSFTKQLFIQSKSFKIQK